MVQNDNYTNLEESAVQVNTRENIKPFIWRASMDIGIDKVCEIIIVMMYILKMLAH